MSELLTQDVLPGLVPGEAQVMLQAPLDAPESPGEDVRLTQQQILLLGVLCAMTVAIGFASALELAPQLEVFQGIICREHYGTEIGQAELAGRDCKLEPIQARLAFIQAWKGTFDMAPGLLLAIFYGKLADRIGRKPVILLSTAGLLTQSLLVRVICWWPEKFPVNLVWATSITLIIGGGVNVWVAMLFAMIADSVPVHYRTTAFSIVMSTFLATQILGPTVAAVMMDSVGPWLPFLISTVSFLVTLLIGIAVPETLKPKLEINAVPSGDRSEPFTKRRYDIQTIFEDLRQKVTDSMNILRAPNSISIAFLLLGFFLEKFGQWSMVFLTQYVSQHFHQSIAKASYLFALRGIMNLVLLLGIIPAITYFFVHRLHVPAPKLELRLAQVSALLLTFSALSIGISKDMPLLIFGALLNGLGGSLDLILRAILTSFVSPDHIAELYTTMAVLTGFGFLTAAPLIAATYKRGLLLGDRWEGLPYQVTGAFYFIAFIAAMFVKLPTPESKQTGDASENEPLLSGVRRADTFS